MARNIKSNNIDIELSFKQDGIRDDVVSFIEIALNNGWIKSEAESK